MRHRFATILLAAISLSATVTAQYSRPNNITHIAYKNRDTIVVVSGQTYAYTVDTSEGQGLVSTNPGVQGLIRQISEAMEITATWQVHDQKGNPKNEGPIETGDRLTMVTDPRYVRTSTPRQTWHLIAAPLAISGRLELVQNEIAANKPATIGLKYTIGQRSPDVTVSISVPVAVEVTMDNTSVNIIGRGEVLLKDLATQSIGRTGANDPYTKVGEATINTLADGSKEITLSHLDLRPSNGADIVLTIHSKPLKRENYLFQASYTTAAPAVLTSPGYYPEMAILQVTR